MKECPYVDDGKRCLAHRRKEGFPEHENMTIDQWEETPCANCKLGKERETSSAKGRKPTCSRCGKGLSGKRRAPFQWRRETPEELCRSCSKAKAHGKRRAGIIQRLKGGG